MNRKLIMFSPRNLTASTGDAARIRGITLGLLRRGYEIHFVYAPTGHADLRSFSLAGRINFSKQCFKSIIGKPTKIERVGDGTLLQYSIPIPSSRFVWVIPKILKPLTLVLTSIRLMIKNRIRTIYLHTTFCIFETIFLKHVFKIAVLYDLHGLRTEEGMLRGQIKKNSYLEKISRMIQKLYFEYADVIITISKEMKRYLISTLAVRDASRIIVVPNGADPHSSSDFCQKTTPNKKSGLHPYSSIIGYLGSDTPYQGIELMLHAFKRACDHENDLGMLFIGELKPNSMNLVKKLKLESRIVITGHLPYTQVEKYLCLVDVALIPRPSNVITRTAFPTKFAEYLAAGKPVISTDVGDVPEIIEKYHLGWAVDSNDIDKFAKTILSAIENKEKLHEISIECKRILRKKLCWDNFAGEIDKVMTMLDKGKFN